MKNEIIFKQAPANNQTTLALIGQAQLEQNWNQPLEN